MHDAKVTQPASVSCLPPPDSPKQKGDPQAAFSSFCFEWGT
jgi:hypothetical protein